MPPLHFSDEEMTLLLELSQPIEPAPRSAFLDAVAVAIEGRAGRASSTRWRGGSSESSGLRRSFRQTRRRLCTAAAPLEGLAGAYWRSAPALPAFVLQDAGGCAGRLLEMPSPP